MTAPGNPTTALWQAADRLTKPTRVHMARVADPDVLTEIKTGFGWACNVADYRAATTQWATVPSLWDQAVAALYDGGGEVGGSGSKPLRERSPADCDLMEIMALIRGTTRHELGQWAPERRVPRVVPSQIRRLASVVVARDSEHLWWWTYRIEQWARLLETYLHAVEHAPKPTRLRGTPCPLCKTRYVTLEAENGERVQARPIVVDYRDGYVRAARCEACTATWFRGAELEALARLVGARPDTPTVADSAC